MHRRVAVLVIGLIASATPALPACAAPPATISLTTCVQSVPPNTIGVLQNDVPCAGNAPFAVSTSNNTILRLNGHTIDGAAFGVLATGRHTTIAGPGTVTGAATAGVGSPSGAGPGTLAIRNVDIRENRVGISSARGRRVLMALDSVRVEDNVDWGIEDCREFKIDGVNVVVRGNGTGNGGGICAGQVVLRNSAVEDNAGVGILNWFGLTRLTDSTATGNGGNTDIPGDVDIAAYRKPRLLKSATCGHSRHIARFPDVGSLPWNVCADD